MLCQPQIVEKLVTKASEIYQVPVSTIVGYSKKPEACIAREMVWLVCKKQMSMSYRCIAKYFSGRNHKAIMSGVRTAEDECKVVPSRLDEAAMIAEGI